ncbi:uncharacterized protein LOC126687187 [Mercurialis annua]|uniref:uncharacterized protein LOC126687187 n=1 Tax=Mercurialis annua TaxID=3986 RepID=UPI0024AE6642|nr:uncharacterized protein LOC126687187 [Mercurialis annua]XP_050237581.2 uncharacterized protein LOC126687187 [Mercurialis annua]
MHAYPEWSQLPSRLFSCDGFSRIGFALTLDDQPLFQGEYPDDYFYEDEKVFGPGNKVSRGFFATEPNWLAVPYLNNRLIEIRVYTGEKCYARSRPIVSPVQIFARFAVMQPGLVASIKIKVRNHRHITTISGSIYARPCCFTHRIPLINSLENTEVAEDGTIALKRSFVAVSSHASLVIVADGLHDQLGNRVTLCANTFFIPAKEAPSEARIMYEQPGSESNILNGRLQAEVEWIPHEFDLL